MLADAHRVAAEDIEVAIASLMTSTRASRLIIEGAWGAAFHWIAFGRQTRHGKHQESHAKLGTFMRSLGETTVANNWERLDQVRQGGWYGSKADPATQQAALDILQDIHQWATT